MEVGGRALKKAIHVARAQAGITSDMQLSLKAGVHYDTLMNWYSERTVPRGHELKKIAAALDIPLADLMAAYEGARNEPEITAAIREQIAAINVLVDELRLQRAEQAGAWEGIARALGVAASIREGEASGPSSGPPSHDGPGRTRLRNGGKSRP